MNILLSTRIDSTSFGLDIVKIIPSVYEFSPAELSEMSSSLVWDVVAVIA